MNTVLLDTHSLLWLDADTGSLSKAAARLIRRSEIAVASVSLYELALLVHKGRVRPQEPVRAWLVRLARDVRAVPVTPSIAATAAGLGTAFPSDPFDRIIYATAIEQGWQVVTKDQRMHEYPADRAVAVW